MPASELMLETRRLGFRLSVADKGMLYVEPAPTPALADRLRAAKPEILARLRIESIAAEACNGRGNVSPEDVLGALAPEDFADFAAGTFPLQAVRAFVLALSTTRWRQEGIAPPGWDKPATCKLCGPVLLWDPVEVAGCPWCWNRLHGVKIPRPPVPV